MWKKEALNLEENKEEYMGELRRRKKEEGMI